MRKTEAKKYASLMRMKKLKPFIKSFWANREAIRHMNYCTQHIPRGHAYNINKLMKEVGKGEPPSLEGGAADRRRGLCFVLAKLTATPGPSGHPLLKKGAFGLENLLLIRTRLGRG